MVTKLKLVFLCCFLVFVIAGCQTLSTSMRDQHMAGWKGQLESYASQIQSQQERFKRRAAEHEKVDLTTEADPWPVLISQVFESAVLIRDAETTQGRHDALTAFIEEMKTAPAPGVLESWFIRRVDQVQADIQTTETKNRDYLATFDQKVREGPDAWITPALLLATNQGRTQGWSQELQSLYKQAIAYYQDIGRAQAEERQLAAEQARVGLALAALGASILLQNNYQQQLFHAMNRPRTCSFVGNVITCY